MKKYLDMTKAEFELILKLMLCTVFSLLIAWALGDPYSVTIAVTANLFLWSDRGYRGSIKYATRRVITQIIQGFLVLLLIFPVKYFSLPIPDVLLIIVACCFALLIGLPINYKHTFAPFNCTIANATFIIACSTVRDFSSFPKRVLDCVIGALIGYFVNYIIFSYKDRGLEITNLVKDSIEKLIHQRDFAAFNKDMELLKKEYSFLIADDGKTRRSAKMTDEQIEFLNWNKQLLEALSGFLTIYEEHKEKISAEAKNVVWELLPYALTTHKQIVEKNYTHGIREIKIPKHDFSEPEEILFLGRLFEYIEMLNKYQH